MRPQVHSFRGFTLIEMLASVAIIGVLMALILPGLNAVRIAGERAKCASNLRGLGAAVHSYAADNAGRLPPGSRASVGNITRLLSEYTAPMKSQLISADVFYCPTNVRLGSPPAAGYPTGPGGQGYKGWSGYFLNYLFNASVFLITTSDPLSSAYVSSTEAQVRLSSIQIPRQTVAFLDMHTRAPGVSGPPTSGLARAQYFNPEDKNFALGTPHNGLGNILFVDGHVESFNRELPLPVNSLPERTTTWWP